MNSYAPSPRTALVVEDDQALLDVLQEVLLDAGFETTAVTSGSPAMRLLAERCFDVLVTDVSLPDTNGLVLCDTARELYHAQIVIVVLTGQKIKRRGPTSLHLGADAFLSKPFTLDELIALLERR